MPNTTANSIAGTDPQVDTCLMRRWWYMPGMKSGFVVTRFTNRIRTTALLYFVFICMQITAVVHTRFLGLYLVS